MRSADLRTIGELVIWRFGDLLIGRFGDFEIHPFTKSPIHQVSRLTAAAILLPLLAILACGGGGPGQPEGGQVIVIDGSSTVFPITEAVAEEFQAANAGTRVTVGIAGTGGGFSKFCAGETDISDASRPISAVEREKCSAAGIEYIELPIAYDGLAVVVNPKNTWVDAMTVAELKRMWAPEAQGKILRWIQIRPQWPDRELHLFGPGVDSGTFDYFTLAIAGKEKASRGDFTSSEDDNVLVQGVAGDELALGYFGYAYYEENRDRLKLVPIDDGSGRGAVAASPETVRDGSYRPLSRPIFIYVSRRALERPEVKSFVDFYLTEGATLVREVGYVPLSDAEYPLVRKRLDAGVTGSMFEGKDVTQVTSLEQLLSGSEP